MEDGGALRLGQSRGKMDDRCARTKDEGGRRAKRGRAEVSKCGRWEKQGRGKKRNGDIGRFTEPSIDAAARVQWKVAGFECLALFSRLLRT
jgi:hypothetical protein